MTNPNALLQRAYSLNAPPPEELVTLDPDVLSLMQQRVTLRKAAKQGDEFLQVRPIQRTIQRGTLIEFGEIKLKVKSPALPHAHAIALSEAVPAHIPSRSTALLKLPVLQKILNAVVEEETESGEIEYGIVFPLKGGLTVGEQDLLEQNASLRIQALKAYKGFVRKLTDQLGKTKKEVVELVSLYEKNLYAGLNDSTISEPEEPQLQEALTLIAPYEEELLKITLELQATASTSLETAVILQQRCIPDLEPGEVQDLPPALYQVFRSLITKDATFAKQEPAKGEIDEDEGEAQEKTEE